MALTRGIRVRPSRHQSKLLRYRCSYFQCDCFHFRTPFREVPAGGAGKRFSCRLLADPFSGARRLFLRLWRRFPLYTFRSPLLGSCVFHLFLPLKKWFVLAGRAPVNRRRRFLIVNRLSPCFKSPRKFHRLNSLRRNILVPVKIPVPVKNARALQMILKFLFSFMVQRHRRSFLFALMLTVLVAFVPVLFH